MMGGGPVEHAGRHIGAVAGRTEGAAEHSWSWRAIHVHYHASLDRLLCELIAPAMAIVEREHRIEQWFFVRFAAGGPHLRLRLRGPGAAATGDAITAMARAFLAREPSRASLADDEVRRITESVLRSDPTETDDAVYPDNTVRDAPFRPEIERYGGALLFERAADYFAVSSGRALRFALEHRDAPRPRQLPVIAGILLGEALGMAADRDDLLALLAHAADPGVEKLEPFIRRGDQAFDQRGPVFVHLLQRAAATITPGSARDAAGGSADSGPASSDPDRVLARAAGALATIVRQSVPDPRRVLASHRHMTANRLGLTGAEEVYLTRAMWRATLACDPGWLADQLARRAQVATSRAVQSTTFQRR
jgi:thiopeptide-type bacteriocin biosynthesis protein